MTHPFDPKLVASGDGKTVMLFGVRFSYKVESADCAGSLAVLVLDGYHRLLKAAIQGHTQIEAMTLSQQDLRSVCTTEGSVVRGP